ncbi:hypothetical protein ACN38_g10870 [Penicillium nordicum]|uniref:Uncharacterized protein n=1 Tax=Penicillium nordicum TaxID=229535 RepID=A0A0M8P0V1_9EURO|nr:hypothetical protein ACN38_g10870 [Penicillium nordicum]
MEILEHFPFPNCLSLGARSSRISMLVLQDSTITTGVKNAANYHPPLMFRNVQSTRSHKIAMTIASGHLAGMRQWRNKFHELH